MSKSKVLVVGGAGYIGSVVVKKLCDNNLEAVVLDNLSRGRENLVDKRAKFVKGDILDSDFLDSHFSQNKYDVVMHFAAAKDAGESMVNLQPYTNNIIGTSNLLKVMDKYGVKKIIFSSSAAVYGEPQSEIIDENHPTDPINYYGFSKLECERIFKWYKSQRDIDYVSLRYFNVAGDGGLDYIDPNAKNIFPIIAEVISGKRDKLEVFGNDYRTRDGSCIRDYIHVDDLAQAHIDALNVNGSEIINLGTSNGVSVLELIREFELVSGKNVNYSIGPRREGDSAILLASSKKAKDLLGWEAKKGLEDMVLSTWKVYDRKNS